MLALPSEPDRPARLLPQVAERLAPIAALPLRSLPAGRPAEALALLRAEPAPSLAPLLLDPGLPLADGCWAEQLAAWRQPTLLVVAAADLATGLPAAAAALLERWQVPLLGLLQWEGEWDAAARRGDGLAWLGGLASGPADPGDGDQAAALRLALTVRRRQLAGLLS